MSKNFSIRKKTIAYTGLSLLIIGLLLVSYSLWPKGENFVADTAVEAHPVPTEVDDVVWQWQVSEGDKGVDVLSGPFGPLAVLEDGVVALDGASGEEVWGYRVEESEDADSVSVGLTPDEERVLVVRTEHSGMEASVETVVVDSRTGDVVERYSYDIPAEVMEEIDVSEAIPDARNVSDHTWISPTENGFAAQDIASGEVAWEFEPDAGCSMVAAAASANFHGAGVGVTGDTYLVPLLCGEEAAPNDGGDATAPGVLLALDAATGEEKWEEAQEVLLTMSRYSGSRNFVLDFSSSVDQESLFARTEEGRTVFDLENGEVIYEDITDFYPEGGSLEYLFHLSEGVIGTLVDTEREARPLRLRMTDLPGGETIDEIEVPGNYDVQDKPSYFSLRPADIGDDAIALDEGLVIAVCDDDCPSSGENSEREILALFVPWGEGEEESIIELPEFNSSGYKNMFVPVPGAVVAYQLTAGSEVFDELIGIG